MIHLSRRRRSFCWMEASDSFRRVSSKWLGASFILKLKIDFLWLKITHTRTDARLDVSIHAFICQTHTHTYTHKLGHRDLKTPQLYFVSFQKNKTTTTCLHTHTHTHTNGVTLSVTSSLFCSLTCWHTNTHTLIPDTSTHTHMHNLRSGSWIKEQSWSRGKKLFRQICSLTEEWEGGKRGMERKREREREVKRGGRRRGKKRRWRKNKRGREEKGCS